MAGESSGVLCHTTSKNYMHVIGSTVSILQVAKESHKLCNRYN